MLQTITKIMLYFAICLGSVVFAQRAVRLKEYYWASGFVAVAVVFSPLELLVKIFLLMGLAWIATFAALVAAFLPQPLPSPLPTSPMFE
jgi:hypothetical protein